MILNKYFVVVNLLFHNLIIWDNEKYIEFCENYTNKLIKEMIKRGLCDVV